MYNEDYRNQFSLLLKILPNLREQTAFTLKGGTAINLFYRDLPRISVDIDLTYTKLENRETTILNMNKGLEALAKQITKRAPHVKLHKRLSRNKEYIVKLTISDEKSIVKIEPNFIFRGTIHSSQLLPISSKVTSEFGEFIDDIPVASFYDVFAGKICAALNRQHPRDLFDIKLLIENEGLSETLRQTFIIYLACDTRPINELLNPNELDISALYTKEFQDMTAEHIDLDELIEVRTSLVRTLLSSLTDIEKEFLLSVKQGTPNYSLLPFDNLEHLPALKWKLINIKKMSKEKHAAMLKKLSLVLEN